ncbi:glycosyltransferase [Candidatus Pelagibacter sp.]|uniref:glycosyltransferase n=1 Tax=Candidatus Pelagibacter sp. TaxID=2024849 RepID=UPI003F84AD53
MPKPTKIYFIENSYDHNGEDLDNPKIGGSEKTTINITNELSKKKNLLIKVFNNTSKPKKIKNVIWENINNLSLNDIPDYVIAKGDANLFYKLNCKKNFLWSHSIQSIEKFIRKKQLFPFLKFKPKLILEGEYHYNKRNFFTSMYGKKILEIAPDFEFLNTKIDKDIIPDANAIFTTKSDRNLDFLINSWFKINENIKNSKLYINPPYELNYKEIKKNIIIRNKGDKFDLINDLKNSRLFLTPGHKTEVFCLAAEEARELCVPIVTMGKGCLYERVIHAKTGYIAKNQNEFINYATQVLSDDNLYLYLKSNLFNLRGSKNYSIVATNFLKILNIN